MKKTWRRVWSHESQVIPQYSKSSFQSITSFVRGDFLISLTNECEMSWFFLLIVRVYQKMIKKEQPPLPPFIQTPQRISLLSLYTVHLKIWEHNRNSVVRGAVHYVCIFIQLSSLSEQIIRGDEGIMTLAERLRNDTKNTRNCVNRNVP